MKLELRLFSGIILILCMFLIPSVTGGYIILFLMQLAMNIALAESWNICANTAGLLSLGHAMFVAISGYVTVVICNSGVPIYISILIGAFASALFAVVISPVLMRLRGVYFAIGTLLICSALQYWFIRWKAAGGSSGLTLRIYPEYSLINCYYFAWIIVIFTYILLWRVTRSKLGLAALATRDDIERSETIGVPTTLVRTFIFGIGAFAAGLVGGVRVAYLLVIEPTVAFSFDLSLWAVLAVVLGGSGTLIGPVLGGTVITSLQYALMGFPELSMLITGSILVLVMLFLPGGLISIVKKIQPSLKRFIS